MQEEQAKKETHNNQVRTDTMAMCGMWTCGNSSHMQCMPVSSNDASFHLSHLTHMLNHMTGSKNRFLHPMAQRPSEVD